MRGFSRRRGDDGATLGMHGSNPHGKLAVVTRR